MDIFLKLGGSRRLMTAQLGRELIRGVPPKPKECGGATTPSLASSLVVDWTCFWCGVPAKCFSPGVWLPFYRIVCSISRRAPPASWNNTLYKQFLEATELGVFVLTCIYLNSKVFEQIVCALNTVARHLHIHTSTHTFWNPNTFGRR